MRLNQKGFSLIELMIVVAIIGILSAVAVPNYIRFQNKAKQSEAKGNLGGIYTAEKALFAEANTFSGRFDAMGFRPEGALNYRTGFAKDGGNVWPANFATVGTTTCLETCDGAGAITPAANCIANFVTWRVNANAVNTSGAYTQSGAATQTQTAFIAEARGVISSNGAADVWSIDNNNNLVNNTPNVD